MKPRRRLLLTVSLALVAAWVVALGGFAIARAARVTPERIAGLLRSSPFSSLSPAERARVLREVARMLNQLSPEDRRTVRLDPGFTRWFR